MKKPSIFLNAAIVGIVFWISACDPVVSQNPADTFWDKKFPKQLEWIRSQLREIPSATQEKIVARIKRDQQRKDLVKVAVIDSGVDIAHPDLLNQIDFRIDNNHIVGAGYDIMGDGKFGSHVLVDPTLFAFGAGSLKNGLIVNPPESPLKLLEQINNRFRDVLIQEIQADPDLKASLFNKLSRDSFTFVGLSPLRGQGAQNTIEVYNSRKAKGEIFTTTGTLDADMAKAPFAEDIMNSWTVMTEDQRPAALNSIELIEHGDKFIEAVGKSFMKVDAEMGLSQKLDLFIEYKNGFKKTSKNRGAVDSKEIPQEIQKAMAFVVFGVDAYDPIRALEQFFKGNRTYKDMSFADAFRKLQASKRQSLEKYLQKPEFDKKERMELTKALEQLNLFGNLVENLIALDKDPVAYSKMRSEIRRFVYRTKHPYIAEASNENAHATHVSGVIAKQHPNVRIVPIRVTTQAVSISKNRTQELADKMLTDLKSFMDSPYFQPLKAEISREYGGLKVSDQTVFNDIKKYLAANSLNVVFIENVLSAIEAAGGEQIKLANVSLGTTFKKSHQLDKKSESMAEDIFSEFARFKIGQTIHEKAPGTLFMIATGNDGGWLDGVSKSGFPVGITSVRLMKIAKEKGLPPSPNNSAKNVLAVGSVNPNGTLTPFTNILLDPNIPQIFSTGEEINSSVPAKSKKASEAIAKKKFGGISLALQKLSRMEMDEVRTLKPDEMLRKIGETSGEGRFLAELQKHLATLLYVQDPIDRANMSGTSMATPTATGLIAAYIAERMAKENIPSDLLYSHPAFTPERIIDDVMKMSKGNSLMPLIAGRMLVDNIKVWNKPKAKAVQNRQANRLLKPRCEGVFAM